MARPDEKWGETPRAFITVAPGQIGLTENEVVSWCREIIRSQNRSFL